eukprot:SAG25_NODE_922_length_4750_cov_27.067512_2_plen_95_part_00
MGERSVADPGPDLVPQSVMRALDNPLKYALKLIEDDLVHAEQEIKVSVPSGIACTASQASARACVDAALSQNPKHVYNIYHSKTDSEEAIFRAL